MAVSTRTEREYLLGSSDAETRRLIQQAALINPFTRRLLADAGIAEGMRVLDAGCGAGDISLMAAEMVGPGGAVVGIDRNAEVLDVACPRVLAAGLCNVTFLNGDLLTAELDGSFDAVVGRLVLIHNPDPLHVLQRLVRYLRPGGIVIFQEYNFTPVSFQCSPPTPLWRSYWQWMRPTLERTGVQMEMGFDLYRAYRAAGLEPLGTRLEALVLCGPDRNQYDWAAATLRSMLPLTQKLGVATAEEIDIDSLAERLRAETLAADAVVKIPELIGIWARKPAA